MNDKELYTIWLPKELKDNLKKEAKQKGLTLSAYIRIILDKRREK